MIDDESYNTTNWNWLKDRIYIEEDGKISMPHVSIDITKECNMRCAFCSHLSPLMHGSFSKDEIFNSIELWSKKINPKRIGILGGEPLLHPNFEDIVLYSHEHWPQSKILVITNGLCIPKLDRNFLSLISKIGRIGFVVSQHIDSPKWKDKIIEMKKYISEYNIPFYIRKSYSKWMVSYQKDSVGHYVPFNSNPQKSWSVCEGKSFYKIHDNKLWYCTRLVSVIQAKAEGIFGKEWNDIAAHVAMSLDNSQQEILNYLKQESVPECSMCPEVLETVVPYQIV